MAYTSQERSRRQYMRRKENGLCPQCGEKLDREGLYCTWCVKKINYYNIVRRKEFREKGICPYCQKAKIQDGEKKCDTCREKQRIYMNRYYHKKLLEKQ